MEDRKSCKVFISHSESDKDLAIGIAKKLEELFLLDEDEVFCFSENKYGVKGKTWLYPRIKDCLSQSNIVLCILSKKYLLSTICLLEYGLALFSEKIIAVAMPDIEIAELPEPIRMPRIYKADSIEDLKTVFKSISQSINYSGKDISRKQYREISAIIRKWNQSNTTNKKIAEIYGNHIRIVNCLDYLEYITQFRGSLQRREKTIDSGYSYMGYWHTVKWNDACKDPNYPVMKRSVDKLEEILSEFKCIKGLNVDYVSLGIGSGEKDFHVLNHLWVEKKGMQCKYVPVDISSPMLISGCEYVMGKKSAVKDRTVPIQIDFSSKKSMRTLSLILEQINENSNSQKLVALLGNTLANFDDDESLLKEISSSLLKNGDYLLLELATTKNTKIDSIKAAEKEYFLSEKFKEFSLQSLLHSINFENRDQLIERNVSVTAACNSKKCAIDIVTSININGGMYFHDGSEIEIHEDEDVNLRNIRLYLTRKYTKKAIKKLLTASMLKVVHEEINELNNRIGFATTLLLLQKNEYGLTGDQPDGAVVS